MFRRKCASLCSYYSYYYSTFPNACPRGKWGWMYYLSFLFHGSRILYCPLHSVRTLICPGAAQTLAVGFRLFSTTTARYFKKITFKKISIFKTFESIRIVRTLNRDSYMNRFFLPLLVLTHMWGFINNNCLIMCVRTVCARLINTDFLVLRHILNFIRRTKYRTFSIHC